MSLSKFSDRTHKHFNAVSQGHMAPSVGYNIIYSIFCGGMSGIADIIYF